MKKILVAVDGSEFSRKVFEYFLERGKKLDDRLTFLQVVRSPRFSEGLEEDALKEEVAKAEEFTKELEEEAKERGVEADSEVISDSNIATGIVKFADENDYDIIGVGARGKSDLGTIHLGSVSEEVVTRATCPVLIVR